MNRMHDQAVRLPYWQTKPCPPWCSRVVDKEAHADADGVPDRQCFSDWQGRVDLTLVEEPYDEWYQHRTRGWIEAEYANIYLVQHYREVDPRVWLGRSDTGHGWHLTAGEARAIADQLVKAADLAEGMWGGAE